MSGFVGIVNFDGAPQERELLLRMTAYLQARGPDAQDVIVVGNVGFGHALLKTTWESDTERQPCTLDGKTWLIADCRIDGRDDLIRELAAQGCKPEQDAPDPELILRAYTIWGQKCVDRLLGDFSFAIWDGRLQTLFCARDHLGLKPFFYAHIGQTLIVSNSLTCLRLHPAVPDRLDELAIADFLVYQHALDADRSSFAAIRRLRPSHALTASALGLSTNRYWQLPLEDELRYRRRSDYVEQFVELFDVATRDRLRTNKVGVFMSGGLDSPTIAATAHRLLRASGKPFDVSAHTMVFDRIVPDEERAYSQVAADTIGIPIRHYAFDDYRFQFDEPAAGWDPPEPRFFLESGWTAAFSRAVTTECRVLLRGDGADPLLEAPVTMVEERLGRGEYGHVLGNFLWLMWTRRQVPLFGFRTFLRKLRGRGEPVAVQPYPSWLSPRLENAFDLRGRWLAETTTEYARPGFEVTKPFWPTFFESIDPGGMRLAAEIRYPFLDLRLVRYLLRVPPIPWTVQKSLLRIAMRDTLPGPVLRRRKAGLAGNPCALMVPPARTPWWDEQLAPQPELEDFVNVKIANEVLAQTLEETQAENNHADIDKLRSSLRPLSLNLWLRNMTRNNVRSSHPLHVELTV